MAFVLFPHVIVVTENFGCGEHVFPMFADVLLSCRYTLLVGKPPFETSNLKDTYQRIRKNEYHIPASRVSPAAGALIRRLLKADPTTRPTMDQVLDDEFFTSGDFITPH